MLFIFLFFYCFGILFVKVYICDCLGGKDRKFSGRVEKIISHQFPNKPHKPLYIPLHTCLLQCRHVLFPALHGDHHPRIAGGHELAVHHEAGGAAVAVHVGMDIDEEEMP